MKTTCPYLQVTIFLFMLTPAESTAKAERLGRARTPLWFESTMKVRTDGKIDQRYRLLQDHEGPSYVLGLLFHRCQEPTKAVLLFEQQNEVREPGFHSIILVRRLG